MPISHPQTTGLAFDEQFNAPDADIIIRSSDGVNFAVYKHILQLASPALRDIISLSTSPPSSLPVADIPEDQVSTRMLLQFCYPRTVCPEPELLGMNQVERAADLAQKYGIRIIREAAKAALVALAATPSASKPYTVALRYGYTDILRPIARRRCSLLPEPDKKGRDARSSSDLSADPSRFLECLDATGSDILGRFRSALSAACADLLRAGSSREHPISWIRYDEVYEEALSYTRDRPDIRCTCEKVPLWIHVLVMTPDSWDERPACKDIRGWWWSYVREIVTAIQKQSGNGSLEYTVNTARANAVKQATLCARCRRDIEKIMSILEIPTKMNLMSEINKRVEEIPLETTLPDSK
ncbi:unnamed protein product [Peniophora sp. CBMAI 1063]|nr:unnamed protein product [Peniophora sp. CBMAI 1063]